MEEQVYAVLVLKAFLESPPHDNDIYVENSPLIAFWFEAGSCPVPEPGSILKVRKTTKRVKGVVQLYYYYYEIVP